MKEIKFRGRDLSGKYRFGFYAESGDVPYIIENCTWYEVEPNSVAQLVGHDKHGKEVYEGDELTDNKVEFYPDDKVIATLHPYICHEVGAVSFAEYFDRFWSKELVEAWEVKLKEA